MLDRKDFCFLFFFHRCLMTMTLLAPQMRHDTLSNEEKAAVTVLNINHKLDAAAAAGEHHAHYCYYFYYV
jgi:hypothetical protein